MMLLDHGHASNMLAHADKYIQTLVWIDESCMFYRTVHTFLVATCPCHHVLADTMKDGHMHGK